MLTVVTWKWPPRPGFPHIYSPDTVNVLRRAVARHYQAPHRFVCVSNDSRGLSPDVEIIPDREDFSSVPSPHGRSFPSCYRRLRLFDDDAAAVFGPRFVSLDLDAVILADMRPVWDRPEPFVIWRDPLKPDGYCGSMFMADAGAHPELWRDFDPGISPAATLKAKCMGSDQGWLRYRLGPGMPTWGREDGVYSFRRDVVGGELPADARVIFFHGKIKPWSESAPGWASLARYDHD